MNGRNLPVEEDDQAEEDCGADTHVWLERRFEDKCVAINALSLASIVKFDVCDVDADPGEECGDGGQVLEPLEDGAGAGGARHVGEERYSASDQDTPERHTSLCALKQESWCLSVLSQGVHVARAGVKEGVGRRGGRCQNDSIDDAGKTGDAGTHDSDHPGRSSGTVSTVLDSR